MNKPTHVFKLTTGIEAECVELTGKQQRLLTEQDAKSHTDKLNDMLASVLIRVGTKTDITPEFVASMLSGDRQKALVECRQFTLDFQKEFGFTYDYLGVDGSAKKEQIHVPLPDGFPVKPVMVNGPEGTLVPASYTDYSEVEKYVTLTLPKSGIKVRFEHLTSKGERWVQALGKKNRSSHTMIGMRFPVYFEQAEKDQVPVQLNLDNLSYTDIEFLRTKIKEYEGSVGTEVKFEHPEADKKPEAEKLVSMDALSTIAFFFPSEAI